MQQATVIYNIAPPANDWENAPNSAVYTVRLRANEVRDTAGNHAPAVDLDSFGVDIDQTPPEATIEAIPLTRTAQPRYEFTITYRDDRGLDAGSFKNGNSITQITVTPPSGGPLLDAVSVDSETENPDGTRTVRYSVGKDGRRLVACRQWQLHDQSRQPDDPG